MLTPDQKADLFECAIRDALAILERTTSPLAQKAAAVLVKALADQHGESPPHPKPR